MSQQIHHSLHSNSLSKSACQGAGVAAVFVIVFLFIIFPVGGVLSGRNFWQSAWEFLPLVTATAGGALGGMIYYLIVNIYLDGWKKMLSRILSVVLYLIIVWLSLIVGFAATGQWD